MKVYLDLWGVKLWLLIGLGFTDLLSVVLLFFGFFVFNPGAPSNPPTFYFVTLGLLTIIGLSGIILSFFAWKHFNERYRIEGRIAVSDDPLD